MWEKVLGDGGSLWQKSVGRERVGCEGGRWGVGEEGAAGRGGGGREREREVGVC